MTMKNIYFLIIIIFSACTANMQFKLSGIDRFKYSGDPKLKTAERIYDNLSETKMSKVLLNYYLTLDSRSFKSSEFRVDTTISNLDFYPVKAIIFSKKAKEGYLKINKYINDSINTKVPIDYLIDSDTVNNEKMIKRLFSLRDKDIGSHILLDDRHISIITK